MSRPVGLVAVSAAGLLLLVVVVGRGLAAVSRWWVGLWDTAPSPSVSAVSGTVSVSGLGWWVWALAAMGCLWVAYLVWNRFKFGFWTL